MKFHDAANIFPLDDEHIDELADDIKQNGQLMPIEILDGKIIDGRRRYTACLQADIEPDYLYVDDVEDPVAYVLSLNLHRRHLTVSQASMCAQRARSMYDEAAKERQKQSGKKHGKGPVNCPEPIPDTGDARDKVGEAFGVSGKSVDRAQHVVDHGIPELAEAVENKDITVYKGYQIAQNPEELQKPLLDAAVATKEKSPKASPQKDDKPAKKPGEKQGVGVVRANEAINCLTRIPKNDPLRKRGFQIVTDWIKANK